MARTRVSPRLRPRGLTENRRRPGGRETTDLGSLVTLSESLTDATSKVHAHRNFTYDHRTEAAMECPVAGCSESHWDFAAHARATTSRNRSQRVAMLERNRYHCDEWCAYRICPHLWPEEAVA